MARLSSDEQRWERGGWVEGELIRVSVIGWGLDQVRTVEWASVDRVQISSKREAAAVAFEPGVTLPRLEIHWEALWVVPVGCGGTAALRGVEASGAAKCPRAHRIAPHAVVPGLGSVPAGRIPGPWKGPGGW